MVDWAFCTAPAEFGRVSPWCLFLEKSEYWTKGLDEWGIQYERRLEVFLQALGTGLGINDLIKTSDSLARCDLAGRAETFGLCMLQGAILLSASSIGRRLTSKFLGPIILTTIYAMHERRDLISWDLKRRKKWKSTWI